MDGRIYGMMSHKGGTGRTVSAANIAFHLALAGKSVCCVDLDVTSATFGAVLGMAEYQSGAAKGIEDLLPLADGPPRQEVATLRDLVKNVWEHNSDGNVARSARGAQKPEQFDLLPGNRDHHDLARWSVVAERLREILLTLAATYNTVIVDVRAGESEIAAALRNTEIGVQFVVFYRWTRQHIAATKAFLTKLPVTGEDTRLVRTAVPDLQSPVIRSKGRAWFFEQQTRLEKAARDLVEFDELGWVPFDPMLQWYEGIITEFDVNKGHALAQTLSSYRTIAENL